MKPKLPRKVQSSDDAAIHPSNDSPAIARMDQPKTPLHCESTLKRFPRQTPCIIGGHARIACAWGWANAASEGQVNHVIRLAVNQNIRTTTASYKELVSLSVQFDGLAAITSEK